MPIGLDALRSGRANGVQADTTEPTRMTKPNTNWAGNVAYGAGTVHEPRAIAELQFSRNDFARTLRTGTAGTIGMMVTKNSSPSTRGFITLYSNRPNFSHSLLRGARRRG